MRYPRFVIHGKKVVIRLFWQCRFRKETVGCPGQGHCTFIEVGPVVIMIDDTRPMTVGERGVW